MQVKSFHLGAYLRDVRKSRSLSTHELERRAREGDDGKSVTAGQISRIENGKTDPGFKTLQRIAELLDLPLVIILDGSREDIDTVTVVSTEEIARSLPRALNKPELVQLLLLCMELTDGQIEAILTVARSIRGSTRSVAEKEDKQK